MSPAKAVWVSEQPSGIFDYPCSLAAAWSDNLRRYWAKPSNDRPPPVAPVAEKPPLPPASDHNTPAPHVLDTSNAFINTARFGAFYSLAEKGFCAQIGAKKSRLSPGFWFHAPENLRTSEQQWNSWFATNCCLKAHAKFRSTGTSVGGRMTVSG